MVDVDKEKELGEQEEDFEYEYEYVEVPEGEELPDSEDGYEYEYEYEYVEVPEDEGVNNLEIGSGDEILSVETGEPQKAEQSVTSSEDGFEEMDLDSFLKENGKDVSENSSHEIDIENLGIEEIDIEKIDFDEFDISPEHQKFEIDEQHFSATDIETISLDEIEGESKDTFVEKTESTVDGSLEEQTLDDFIAEQKEVSAPEQSDDIVDVEFEEEKEIPTSSEDEEEIFYEITEPIVQEEKAEEEAIEEPKIVSEYIPVVADSSICDVLEGKEREINIAPSLGYKVIEMSDEAYENSVDASKVVTKTEGISVFYSTRKQNKISISGVDMKEEELREWNLVVLDRKIVPLEENKENIFPLMKNSVRLAKLIKNGQERVSFFDEEAYNVPPKTDSFGMVKGKFVVGPVEDDSGLLINDFINISLENYSGKELAFEEPVSGMLIGPKGAIVYFSNLRGLILPRKIKHSSKALVEKLIDEVDAQEKFYELSAQEEEKEFVGNEETSQIQINVGITTYGWNVVFDNDVTMSVKDLMTYQSRNKKMISENGKIIYGRKVFEFRNIKSIVLYETPQYFSYGR